MMMVMIRSARSHYNQGDDHHDDDDDPIIGSLDDDDGKIKMLIFHKNQITKLVTNSLSLQMYEKLGKTFFWDCVELLDLIYHELIVYQILQI